MTRQLNIKDAINEALHQEMALDERVIIFGEDIAGGAGRDEEHPEAADAWGGPFGVTKGLLPKFGRERVIDTAIAETGFIGASVGAAYAGLRPVAEIMYIDFIGTSFDQVFNQAAKMRYVYGGKVFVDERTIEIDAPAHCVFRAVCRIGGGHGWYAADWLWRLRGWMDKLAGGPGLLERDHAQADELRHRVG